MHPEMVYKYPSPVRLRVIPLSPATIHPPPPTTARGKAPGTPTGRSTVRHRPPAMGPNAAPRRVIKTRFASPAFTPRPPPASARGKEPGTPTDSWKGQPG